MTRARHRRRFSAQIWLIALLNLVMLGSLAGGLVLVATSGGDMAAARMGGEGTGGVGAAGVVPDLPRSTLTAAGVPADGTPLFSEDFSQRNASTAAIGIGAYTGPGGMTYSSDAAWTPAAARCNGWVVNESTPLPPVAQDAGCGQPWFGQYAQMAAALGQAEGQSVAASASNQMLTEYTAGATQTPGYLLKTNSAIPATGGHFYAVSGYFAETSCNAAHAQLTFSLTVNGAANTLANGLDPCTATGGVVYPGDAHVVKLVSGAVQAPAGNPVLGMQLYNASDQGQGNDMAFDLPQIVDVTPTLDASFSPATMEIGQSSTLTFTITNTTDLAAKTDWSFSEGLPTGMTLANGTIGGTCAQRAGASFVTSAVAGGTTIGVTGGDLGQGQASCTITASVTTALPGTFTHSAANVATGLLPPTASTLTVTQNPAIDLTATADQSSLVVGQQVTYTYTATNTGDVTLSAAAITPGAFTGSGALSDLSCDPAQPADLAPGDVLTCTATYTPTQADIDSGTVDDAASASGMPPDGPAVTGQDHVELQATDRTGSWTFDKQTAPDGLVDVNDNQKTDAGDTVAYEFVVTNTGDVTLSHPVISDPKLAAAGITISCPADTVAPGAAMTCTPDRPYVITQADVDAGGVSNSATSSADAPAGVTAPDPVPADSVVPTSDAAGIDVKVTADQTDVVAGQQVTYTYTATNTGDVTLSGVGLDRSGFTGTGDLSDLTCTPQTPATLAPGEQLICTATYTVTQADVDAGQVADPATATGHPVIGAVVTGSNEIGLTADRVAGWTLDKRVEAGGVVDVDGDGKVDAGDTIAYQFVFTNTGDVDLSDPTVSDPKLASAGITISCPDSTVAPGAAMTCTPAAPYTITQADVDAGGVSNSATAEATPPARVAAPPPARATATTPTVMRAPSVALSTRVVRTHDVDHDGLLDLGDDVDYGFVVTNTGNVTLHAVAVAAPLLSGSHAGASRQPIGVSCPAETLAPGRRLTCVAAAPYVVTAADVAAGEVVISAHATAESPPGAPQAESASDRTATALDAQPTDHQPSADQPTDSPSVGAKPSDTLPNTGAPSLMLAGAIAWLLLTLGGLVLILTHRRSRVEG